MKEIMPLLARTDLAWSDRVAMLAYQLSQPSGEEIEVKHSFRSVWYIREMRIPADTYFIGRPHIEGHILKLLNGRAAMIYEGRPQVFVAPAVVYTKPEFQAVAYTYTDVLVQTWHLNPDNCRDLEALENSFFGPAEPVLARGKELSQLQLEVA